MTEEMSQSREAQHPQTFGNRLKSVREDLRLDLKDVASQLRLRPSIIEMLEKEMYSDDVPITFLRGYLRSYAKFLEIPEQELNMALSVAPFQAPVPEPVETDEITEKTSLNKILKYADKSLGHVSSSQSYLSRFAKKYVMRLVTFIIIFTLGYLVLTWWNAHKNQPPALAVPTQAVIEPKLPTLAEASDQDLEAANDDQALVFEQDAAATAAPSKPAKPKQPELTLNEPRNIIDIYNE